MSSTRAFDFRSPKYPSSEKDLIMKYIKDRADKNLVSLQLKLSYTPSSHGQKLREKVDCYLDASNSRAYSDAKNSLSLHKGYNKEFCIPEVKVRKGRTIKELRIITEHGLTAPYTSPPTIAKKRLNHIISRMKTREGIGIKTEVNCAPREQSCVGSLTKKKANTEATCVKRERCRLSRKKLSRQSHNIFSSKGMRLIPRESLFKVSKAPSIPRMRRNKTTNNINITNHSHISQESLAEGTRDALNTTCAKYRDVNIHNQRIVKYKHIGYSKRAISRIKSPITNGGISEWNKLKSANISFDLDIGV